jgi:hypothetical protein
MAGARKAKQQQQRLRVGRPRFAIENIEVLDTAFRKLTLCMTNLSPNTLTSLTAV